MADLRLCGGVLIQVLRRTLVNSFWPNELPWLIDPVAEPFDILLSVLK